MEARSAEQPLTKSDVKEVRIALAFFGGVALAVYESGVAFEFFRLVKGEGVYAKLREKVGSVVVDIITGTSAGGLNGALLGNALVNRGDITKLLTLWLDEGDIGKLLYGPWKVGPQSLLDGDYFRKKIFEALMAKRAAPKHSLQPYLDLYITATNVDGDRVVVETPTSGELATRTHRQIFRFRYQQRDPALEMEEINDFKSEDDTCLLTKAARASASFPLAFEPELIKKSELGRRAAQLEADAYHIDGGVLDNKPIARALEAIAARSADKEVDRLLFYIEPDPEHIDSRSCEAPRCYTPAEVVLKALIELPGYQSITTALQDIQRHNRNVSALRRTLDYYETAAARFRSERSAQGPDAGKDFEYHAPNDAPTALFRAQEDGYLDLRLERDLSANILALCSELAGASEGGVTALEERMANALKPLVYRIKCVLLWSLDLKYAKRMCRYLVQVVRSLYPRADISENQQEWLVAIRQLNLLKAFLYQQEERVLRYERAQAERLKAVTAEIEGHLQALSEEVRSRRLSVSRESENFLGALGKEAYRHAYDEWDGFWRKVNAGDGAVDKDLSALCALLALRNLGEGEKAAALEDRLRPILSEIEQAQKRARETQKKIEENDLVRDRCKFFDGLRHTIRQKLDSDGEELKRSMDRGSKATATMRVLYDTIDQGLWKLRDALHSFYLRDMMIYPLLQSEQLAGELQTINFARISPADADHYMSGLTASEKVAGEKFAHFGGFFSEKWRGNDLTWGRLDAAEIILRRLLAANTVEAEQERRALIKKAHEEILEEMRKLSMHIYNPTDRAPERKDLIGREDISAVPASLKLDWLLRGTITMIKIMRKSWADSKVAAYVPKVTALVDLFLNILIGIYLFFTAIARRVFRWRILGLFLIAVLFMAIGILLWQYSLRDLWISLAP